MVMVWPCEAHMRLTRIVTVQHASFDDYHVHRV